MTKDSTATVTPEQHLTVVKHLAGGKSLDVVATLTHLDRSTVVDIGSKHGYPDTEKLTWAVDILTKKLDDDAAPTQHPQANAIARSTPPPNPASRIGRALTTGSAEPPLRRPDEIRVLINTAKNHPSKRIQAAGDKVIDAVDRLKTLIHEDQERNAEKRRAAQQRSAARAEVERLEAQLRAAKARLRGDTPGTSPVVKVSKEVSKPTAHPCQHEGCDRAFDNAQGLALHRRRAHEGFNPNAAHQAAS